MKCLKLVLPVLLLVAMPSWAQEETLLPASKLLQYESAKMRGKAAGRMFKKAGLERIPAHDVLRGRESCILWGYEVRANLSYDSSREPLYRLFRKTRLESMGLIDHIGGKGQPVELVFWDKRIYRSYAAQLAHLGFRQHVRANIISFRQNDYNIGVDVEIWPDIYVMRVLQLQP